MNLFLFFSNWKKLKKDEFIFVFASWLYSKTMINKESIDNYIFFAVCFFPRPAAGAVFSDMLRPVKSEKKSLSNTESRMQKRKICNTKGDPGRHHKRNHSSLKPAWSCIPIRLILFWKSLRNWKAIAKQKKFALIDCKWPRIIKSGPGVLKGGPGSLKKWPRLGHLWKSGPAWITPKNTTFSYSVFASSCTKN